MIRALFFDAAGTLIEPVEPVAAVYAREAAAAGIRTDASSLGPAFAATFSSLGDPAWEDHPDGDTAERAWWEEVVRRTLLLAADAPPAPDRIEACFRSLFAHYAHPSAWRIFPEVPQALELARGKGWKTAVVSNFDRRLHRILSGLDLEFDVVVTSADSACRKPGAAVFHEALRRAGCRAEETLHAGDSSAADVVGAAAAGIRAFLIDRPRSDLRDFIAWAEIDRK